MYNQSMLQPHDPAPLDITIKDENDQPVSLRSLLGNCVVLYFYPRDNTPGCTTEACSFRDINAELADKYNAKVIGVSKDSVASHQKFKEKHQLNFPLWSDPEHKLLEAFGSWQEKKNYGKIYMGIVRSTFIIDPEGTIIKTWEKVSPKTHDQEVMQFFEQLDK